MKKRKKFDLKQMRILGSEHAEILKHNEIMQKKGKVETKPKKTGKDWRAQSEMFRQAMKVNNPDNNNSNFGNKLDVVIVDSNPKSFKSNTKDTNSIQVSNQINKGKIKNILIYLNITYTTIT